MATVETVFTSVIPVPSCSTYIYIYIFYIYFIYITTIKSNHF